MDYKAIIERQVQKEFELASRAKKNGKEISDEPEIYIATDIAEKVEGLIGLRGISDTIRKISKESKEELSIALDLCRAVLDKEPDREKGAELAVRAGLAYLTQGAVAAPLEGIAKVKIRTNPDNTNYLSIYYAGPIRAAGGTAASSRSRACRRASRAGSRIGRRARKFRKFSRSWCPFLAGKKGPDSTDAAGPRQPGICRIIAARAVRLEESSGRSSSRSTLCARLSRMSWKALRRRPCSSGTRAGSS